jgi:hypothetical protein
MWNYVKVKVAVPVYKTKITAVEDPSPLYPRKLAIISPTSGSCSVSIVLSRIQATEFVFVCFILNGKARGSVVVKALFYKPEGRGFHTL